MKYYGLINNRIFDCLASGLPVISDEFPELRQVVGDEILYASDPESFHNSYNYCESNYEEVIQRAHDLWEKIGVEFTFDARARELIDEINRQGTGRKSKTAKKSGRSKALIEKQ